MRAKFDIEIKKEEYKKDIQKHNKKTRASISIKEASIKRRMNGEIYKKYPELEAVKQNTPGFKAKQKKMTKLRRGRKKTKKEIADLIYLEELLIEERLVLYSGLIKKEINRLNNGTRSDRLYAKQLELEVEYVNIEEKERILQRIEDKLGSKMSGDFTLAQIAKTYGLSRERVRQIEAAVMKALKHPANKRKLQIYNEHDFSTNVVT